MSFFDGVTKDVLENIPDRKVFVIGDNPCRIKEVKECQSKNGKDMLALTFAAEDDATIKWYIVEGEYKLKKLKNLMSSFGIPLENCYAPSWIGKRGIVVCEEDAPYNGHIYPKVSYCKVLESETPVKSEAPVKKSGGFDDDIPF